MSIDTGMENTRRTDQELVNDALRDKHAFAVIVKRYEAPLRRYAYRLGVARREDADDVLQEAFIKMYVNLNDFDTTLSFSAWMYRIVHNEVISHFRRQNARPQIVATEEELGIFERVADETDLAAEADKKLTADIVRKAITGLSPRYREVLILRFLEDKTYDEIADILEIPSGTVATYVNRGKKELAVALKKFYERSVYYMKP